MAAKLFSIDMQNHYIPSEALKLARKTEEYDYTYSISRFVKAYERMSNIDEHINWMDQAGLDMAVLSTAAFSTSARGISPLRTLSAKTSAELSPVGITGISVSSR